MTMRHCFNTHSNKNPLSASEARRNYGLTSGCEDTKFPLIFIQQGIKLNSEVCQQLILELTWLPWVQEVFQGKKYTFTPDRALSHNSRPR
uniref:Uncharacterized protein n=1 Tax=Lepeophtheirus salmonis TaxID=72036 RepID=A0A0K2U2P2_LEPSM